MNSWTHWLSSAFGIGILAMAVAAGWRAAPVQLGGSAALIDGQLTRQFESHYDAVFPARTFGVNLWGAIDYLLFREGRPGVVIGGRDWLYSSEEFSAPPGAEARLEAHLAMVPKVRDQLKARGVQLVVALLPAKARVYPEYLDHHQPDALHRLLYDRALADLRARGILAPDLFGTLLLCKHRQAVFLRSDTHWTAAGAHCVARQLAREARAAGLTAREPVRYRTTTESFQPHRGDLVKFLALDPWFEGLLPDAERIDVVHTARVGPAPAGDALLGEEQAPGVALIGTSYSANAQWNFAGALQETLGEDVANYAVQAEGPFRPMLDYLKGPALATAQPRLVIWEMPERYFAMDDGPDTASTHVGDRL